MGLNLKQFYKVIDGYGFRNYSLNSESCDQKTFDELNSSIDKIISHFENQEKNSPEIDYRLRLSLPRLNTEEEFFDGNYKKLENIQWFNIVIGKTIYNGVTYLLVIVDDSFNLQFDSENINQFYDYSFITEIIDSYFDLVTKLFEKDIYREMIKFKNFKYRYGSITYENYWKCFPKSYKSVFYEYSERSKNQLLYELKFCDDIEFATHFKKMTANKYYQDCMIAFKTLDRFNQILTPKENFYRNADGRVQGLDKINDDSSKEFDKRYKENENWFDHTFEISPSGSRTRISLYVEKDENGYYYYLTGNNFRTLLTMGLIFLRFLKEGIRVKFGNEDKLINILEGKEKLDVVPIYTSMAPYFEELTVKDLRNKRFIASVKWSEEAIPNFKKD